MSTAVPPPDRTETSRTDPNDLDRTTTDRPDTDRTTTDRPDTDRTTTDRPDTDRTTTDRPDTDRTTTDRPDTDRTTADPQASGVSADDTSLSRKEVVARQKERFGGMKFGACFFGWLTATGMAVLLTGLLAAAGAGLGLATDVDPTDPATAPIQTVGLVGGLVLLVIILISYFAGGYVAGRMARFAGAKQGLGVWLWALIIAVVVAILGAVAGSQFNLLANLNGFPRIPVNEGDLTTAGIITAVAVALVALIGAILGGTAGMAYHRRVDKEGLGR